MRHRAFRTAACFCAGLLLAALLPAAVSAATAAALPVRVTLTGRARLFYQ